MGTFRTLKEVKDTTEQLSFDFPGCISKLGGDQKPRLKAMETISIFDLDTGEKFVRAIGFMGNDPEELIKWIPRAISHERTIGDVKSFLRGRER